jgi:hypothetical protein
MANVLVIGRHPAHMETVLHFLRQHGYTARGETQNSGALAIFAIEKFDVVVIGGGVGEAARKEFKEKFTRLNSKIKFVEHYGSPDSLPSEIESALKQ